MELDTGLGSPARSGMRLTPLTSRAFDLLRIVGAEMVVIGHGFAFTQTGNAFSPPHSVYLQNLGVIIFFFVSGFLICKSASDGLAQPGGAYTFADFLLDRATRIYCGLVPALLVICLLDWCQIAFLNYSYTAAFNLQTLFANLAFLQDYPHLPFTSFGSGRPLWTLAVEWWLYMAFGAIYLPWPKAWASRVFLFILSAAAVPVVFVSLVHNGLAAIWIIGAWTVWALPITLQRVKAAAFAGFLGLAVIVLFRDARLVEYDFHFNVVLAFFLAGLIALLNTVSAPVGGRWQATVQYAASYSYTLYLTHYSIWEIVGQLHSLDPRAQLIIGVVASNIVAAAVAHFGERKYKTVRTFLRKRIIFEKFAR